MGRMADAQREVYERLEAAIRALAHPDEQILGMLTASDSKTFTQQMYAIGVTPGRLLMVPVSLRWQPKGDPFVLLPGDIESAKETSLRTGADASSLYAGFAVGTKLTFKTTDGRKFKLILDNSVGFEGEGPDALFHWIADATD